MLETKWASTPFNCITRTLALCHQQLSSLLSPWTVHIMHLCSQGFQWANTSKCMTFLPHKKSQGVVPESVTGNCKFHAKTAAIIASSKHINNTWRLEQQGQDIKAPVSYLIGLTSKHDLASALAIAACCSMVIYNGNLASFRVYKWGFVHSTKTLQPKNRRRFEYSNIQSFPLQCPQLYGNVHDKSPKASPVVCQSPTSCIWMLLVDMALVGWGWGVGRRWCSKQQHHQQRWQCGIHRSG